MSQQRKNQSAKSPKKTQPKANKTSSSDVIILPTRHHLQRSQKIIIGTGAGILIMALAILALRISYTNKVYPGVRSYGVYLGGLSGDEAKTLLTTASTKNASAPVAISAGSQTISTSAADLEANPDVNQIVSEALAVGREGTIFSQIRNQVRYALGQGENIRTKWNYNSEKFAILYSKVADAASTLTQNASFQYDLPSVTISPDKTGKRVDIATFADSLSHALEQQQTTLAAPLYELSPTITSTQLTPLQNEAATIANSNLTLTFNKKSWQISQKDLLAWLNISSKQSHLSTDYLMTYYPRQNTFDIGIDPTVVANYIGSLAPQINTTAVDAQLTVTDGRATVFAAARDGATLDTHASTEAVLSALKDTSTKDKSVALVVKIDKANVRDDTIDQLGIHDLLAEGVTYFPGSSSNRLNNIRVGQSRFQGVLIKPDEVFSFGKQMGPVGPEQGYLPGLVILNGHEENQYGGGMCQVSSTLFRAALQAGLPIVERHNHAFAVSFYTAPYGVPGIDATIYYPGVDLKIKNDTGHYILIQTEMKGTTLKFRLYGTKSKEGIIRGPNFVEGSNDATKPSTTVFYRDVMVNGQVTKTDTFTTHYKSSLDFPISAD